MKTEYNAIIKQIQNNQLKKQFLLPPPKKKDLKLEFKILTFSFIYFLYVYKYF